MTQTIIRHGPPAVGAQQEAELPVPSGAARAEQMPTFLPLGYWLQGPRAAQGCLTFPAKPGRRVAGTVPLAE